MIKVFRNMESKTLTVIGLGYIGLPTAVILAQHGWRVVGVDISDRTIDLVSRGRLPFVEEGLGEALKEVVDSGALIVQSDTPKSTVYIISVPTPFKGDHEADLSYIDAATDGIIPQLEGDELIILESTSPPGTTEHIAERVMAARPEFSLDGNNGTKVVHFAHAPERVLPGRIMVEMVENDRIIGGLTDVAKQKTHEVYSSFCRGALHTTDARTAEMAKLTENAFRDVNIAFANELSLICDRLGINVWELIQLANKHPRVNILQPGPGVGGHCIAVDPWFIVSADRANSQLIRTAREVNDAKPNWVLDQVEECISASTEDKPTVGILGLSFKPNIDDLRESPALKIATRLVERNPSINFNVVEPHVSECPAVLSRHSNISWGDYSNTLEKSGIIVLLVDHDAFSDLSERIHNGQQVIDTRGVCFGA